MLLTTKPSKTTTNSNNSFYLLPSLMLPLLIMATFIFSSHAYALSKVTAVIDKNPAMVNESILLTLTADDDVNRNALDTSPLLKDFIVGQTSVSSQTSSINFKTSRTTQWKIVLIARSAGQFIIPALTIENQQSRPVELTVVASKNTQGNNQTDIFITSELSSNNVYVQQSLTLAIKLHFAVELQSASITEPSLTGATIEKVSKDKQSDTIVNGKRYRVIEQNYAITPEQSGEFTLKAPVFSGEVRQASNRRSSFLNFSQTKPVSVVGNELNLTVLPIPTSYPSNSEWLPTEILTLHQEWQSDNTNSQGEFTVGEPITRTITLTAAGLSKAQLPKLVMNKVRGLKIYPDQAELHSTLREGRLVSQKIQNFALVPSTVGNFTLPAMSVTWFNTVTNKIEQATLASKTITVIASEDDNGLTPNSFNNQNSHQHNLNAKGLNEATLNNNTANNSGDFSGQSPQKPQGSSQSTNQDKRLQWLFLSLWLLTSFGWFVHLIYLKKSKPKNIHAQAPPKSHNAGNTYLTLVAACKKNNAEQALSLLLPWLKQLLDNDKAGIEISNIAQAQAIIKEQSLINALDDLQQYLYGKGASNNSALWTGTALLSAIQTVNKQQTSKGNTSPPFTLNP